MRSPLLLSLPLLLTGCSLLNTPPQPRITAPSPEATVGASAPVTVQVEDDGELSRVELYARPRGASTPGFKVGSSSAPASGGSGSGSGDSSGGSSQFTVTWNTAALPNLSELELYAVAVDDGGLSGQSEPIPLTVSSSAPNLRYFASITLPKAPEVVPAAAEGGGQMGSEAVGAEMGGLEETRAVLERPDLRPVDVQPATGKVSPAPAAIPSTHSSNPAARTAFPGAQSVSERNQVLEWAWDAVSGARGYVPSLSKDGRLSGFVKQDSVRSENASGLQKYSKLYPAATLTQRFHGTVSALLTSGEGPRSNTFETHFLEPQPAGTASNLSKGRPALSWSAHPDPEVIGYYYWVYKKSPLLSPQEVATWTNSGGRTTARLSATYPAERDALPRGRYFFWIAGVSFNPEGGASGFSFSELQTFEVK